MTSILMAVLRPVYTYNDGWEIIYTNFVTIIKLPETYTEVRMFSEQKAVFQLHSKPLFGMGIDSTRFGFINNYGIQIIPPTFADDAKSFG